MKKHYILISLIFASFSIIAQIQESNLKSYSSSLINVETNSIKGPGTGASTASIDTIWSDDFSNSLNWNYVGGNDEWNIDTILTANLIADGFDPKLNSVSGGNFALIDSDGSGSSGTQDAVIEYVGGSIDCSLYPNVRLVFQTYLSQFQESRQVLVSNDGGTVWDTIDVLTQFGNSVTSPNGYVEVVNISSAAGGQSNVKIKFRYVGSFDWFWSIDDIQMVSAPANDLELTQEYYNTTSDESYTNYYSMIPKRQADSAVISFGAKYKNIGSVDQTNSKIITTVDYNNVLVYVETSDSITLSPNLIQVVDVQNTYTPSLGLGTYDMKISVSADSVDEIPDNNVVTKSFEVTGNQYRRDNDSVTNSNWYDITNAWEMLVKYEMYTEDSAVAISVYFPISPSTGRGVVAGDLVSFYLYNATNLITPITENEFYEVLPSDENGWITLPIPIEKLEAGIYYVGFKVYNTTSSVGSNSDLNTFTAPLTVLVRKDAVVAEDPWLYTTSFTPFVRLFTHNLDACTGVTINVTTDVNDSIGIGAIETSVTGGAAPYTYSWTGPNGYTSTAKSPNDIADTGSYIVIVTDIFGCAGTDTANVAGIVTVNEIGFLNDVSLYPNPNKGTVNIKFTDSAAGVYKITFRNVLGSEIVAKTVLINSNATFKIDLSYLNRGFYFVEIRSSQNEIQVLKFILE